jgi:hypothetical protein
MFSFIECTLVNENRLEFKEFKISKKKEVGNFLYMIKESWFISIKGFKHYCLF